jgi:hypothetical protein
LIWGVKIKIKFNSLDNDIIEISGFFTEAMEFNNTLEILNLNGKLFFNIDLSGNLFDDPWYIFRGLIKNTGLKILNLSCLCDI